MESVVAAKFDQFEIDLLGNSISCWSTEFKFLKRRHQQTEARKTKWMSEESISLWKPMPQLLLLLQTSLQDKPWSQLRLRHAPLIPPFQLESSILFKELRYSLWRPQSPSDQLSIRVTKWCKWRKGRFWTKTCFIFSRKFWNFSQPITPNSRHSYKWLHAYHWTEEFFN